MTHLRTQLNCQFENDDLELRVSLYIMLLGFFLDILFSVKWKINEFNILQVYKCWNKLYIIS